MNDETTTSVRGSHPITVARDRAKETVTVDCGRCVLRAVACSDCLIGALVGPPRPVEWDETELRAIEALVEGGLVPKLRLTPMRRAARGKAA
jgi:hypothetical protein